MKNATELGIKKDLLMFKAFEVDGVKDFGV